MKYLCLIHLDEEQLAAMPAAELSALNAAHLDFNDDLRKTGHFIVAEALEPAAATATIRVRQGQTTVTDGPFAETKEMVAGFYLIEARDLAEAVEMAVRIPSAPLATIEVRPARQLVVEGRPLRWG
jgi:hypothetical protein